MNNLFSKASLGFLLIFLGEPSFAQEWVKPSAGRPEYVRDRTACVQEAQSMALPEEAFDKDVIECLVSKGWQRNLSDKSMPVYCADKEAVISCKPGGTEEMYKKDRAECTDQMMKTIGTRYSQPGWWGLGGLIVSAIQTEQNKTNLRNAQLQFMKICLEGKNWTVEFKGESVPSPRPPADYSPPAASIPAPVSNPRGATATKGIPGESKYMIEAERLAKSSGCAEPLAAMTFKGAGQESFIVECPNATKFAIRCEVDGCRILE